jgi:hypothetical protein
MGKIRILFILLFLAGLSFTAFAQDGFTIMGIMQHSNLEGGCWFLQAKHKKYELTGSPEILQTCRVEGRMLTLRVRQAKMMASVCMIGDMVEVLEVIDSVSHPHNPPFTHEHIKGIIHKSIDGCWYVLTAHKKRYELQGQIPKKFMHAGRKYNRMSTVLPGSESNCRMDYVIPISELDPDMKPKEAREKKSDPR